MLARDSVRPFDPSAAMTLISALRLLTTHCPIVDRCPEYEAMRAWPNGRRDRVREF